MGGGQQGTSLPLRIVRELTRIQTDPPTHSSTPPSPPTLPRFPSNTPPPRYRTPAPPRTNTLPPPSNPPPTPNPPSSPPAPELSRWGSCRNSAERPNPVDRTAAGRWGC